MKLKTFFQELDQHEALNAWRLGGVQWQGDTDLRVKVSGECGCDDEVPVVSNVTIDCGGVLDAHLQLKSHPHNIGEFWITNKHPMLDEFDDWYRLIAENQATDPERLYARLCELVADIYGGDASRAAEYAGGIDWRGEGYPFYGELACGPEHLMRDFHKIAREHCPGVKLEKVRMVHSRRPKSVVGFSENWIMCDTATVIHADGELGGWLELDKKLAS